MHHAYFYAGDTERGAASALAFGERELGLSVGHPGVVTLRYSLFSVNDARFVSELASRTPSKGDVKLIIVAASRIFHEAQNALLKTFEEPPVGTHLVLVVPSEGDIIATLRSRLLPLPEGKETASSKQQAADTLAGEFLKAGKAEREKLIAKILDRAKSDDADEKQAARADALRFAEGLARAAYAARLVGEGDGAELTSFLSDLDRLIPILHERSAPLKPILEHLSLAVPASLKGS